MHKRKLHATERMAKTLIEDSLTLLHICYIDGFHVQTFDVLVVLLNV